MPTSGHTITELGLPSSIDVCLFDLDGVITRTSVLHAEAWKQTFDAFLCERAERTGEPFVPFDADRDYARYVDGLPRAAGTRSFLASRGIELPEGGPGDPVVAPTVSGLSSRKDALVRQLIETRGVQVYPGSQSYLAAVRAAGLRTAVVSSSRNTTTVLSVTGLADRFDLQVDGQVAARDRLAGKPAPDTFLAAASRLGSPPERAAVFEDALAGVAAGRAGGFGWVVGVDRLGQAEQLRRSGADVVVQDLAELLTGHGAGALR